MRTLTGFLLAIAMQCVHAVSPAPVFGLVAVSHEGDDQTSIASAFVRTAERSGLACERLVPRKDQPRIASCRNSEVLFVLNDCSWGTCGLERLPHKVHFLAQAYRRGSQRNELVSPLVRTLAAELTTMPGVAALTWRTCADGYC